MAIDTLRILVDRCRNGIDLSTAWRMLEIMQEHGQSVTLAWRGDTRKWECSWLSDGEWFIGYSVHLQAAILYAARNAVEALSPERAPDGS